jgi:hypothetical protein
VDAADLGYTALGKWMEEAYLVPLFSLGMRSGDGTGGGSSAYTCRVWVDDGKKLLKV